MGLLKVTSLGYGFSTETIQCGDLIPAGNSSTHPRDGETMGKVTVRKSWLGTKTQNHSWAEQSKELTPHFPSQPFPGLHHV